MQFEECLEAHKENFEPFRAMVVLDDKALRRYVLCWGPMLVRRVSDWPLGNTLHDLWDCVTVNFKALGDLTGDSLPEVMGYFRQAQGMQLIYPDGSIEVEVVRVLDKRMKLLE